MNYKFLFVLNALVALVFGVGFLVVPNIVLQFFGVSEQYASTMWASRFYGSAMVALGLVLWFAKDVDESAQKGMGWALLISMAIGLVVSIAASVSSKAVIRSNSWIPIVIYVLLGLGYAFMLFMKPRMKE